MTHERASTPLIGITAAAVFAGDLAYAATHWHGAFRHAYLSSLIELFVLLLFAVALRLSRNIGPSRLRARWTQRVRNGLFFIAIWVFVGVGFRDHSFAGQMLGILVVLAVMFVVVVLREYTRARPS